MTRNYFLLALLILVKGSLLAQPVTPGTELQELVKISEVYSHIPNLGFDMRYTYTDSLTPSTIVDSSFFYYKASYGKMLLTNDEMDMLQGQEYSVYVSKTDSIISVARRQPTKTVFQAPLMDPSFRNGYVTGMSVQSITDSLWRFRAFFKPECNYLSYTMDYDPLTGLVKTIFFNMRNVGGAYDIPVDHVVHFTYQMTNYSGAAQDAALFNENRYFYVLNGVLYLQPDWQTFQLQTY